MESFSEVVYLLNIPSLLLDQGSRAKSSSINCSVSSLLAELAYKTMYKPSLNAANMRSHEDKQVLTPGLFVVAIVALSAANMDRGSIASAVVSDWLLDSGSIIPCSYVFFFLPDFLSMADWNKYGETR